MRRTKSLLLNPQSLQEQPLGFGEVSGRTVELGEAVEAPRARRMGGIEHLVCDRQGTPEERFSDRILALGHEGPAEVIQNSRDVQIRPLIMVDDGQRPLKTSLSLHKSSLRVSDAAQTLKIDRDVRVRGAEGFFADRQCPAKARFGVRVTALSAIDLTERAQRNSNINVCWTERPFANRQCAHTIRFGLCEFSL